MSHAINKEKKNIVADPVFEAVKGKRVSLSTIKGDYDDVLVLHYDQFTLIVEIDGKHLLLGKSSIVDLTIPDDMVATVLNTIDEAFKTIEFKQDNAKERKKLKRDSPNGFRNVNFPIRADSVTGRTDHNLAPASNINAGTVQPTVQYKKKRTY